MHEIILKVRNILALVFHFGMCFEIKMLLIIFLGIEFISKATFLQRGEALKWVSYIQV